MARRTISQMAAAISRHVQGQVGYREIIDAIDTANKEIYTLYEWPWLRAEANILIKAPYNTGTVSCSDGSEVVTLNGGTWDTGWDLKRLFMGNNNIDLQVLSIDDSTHLTLVQPINFGASVVDQPYTLYQDTYRLPNDCEFGGMLLIVNPIYRYRLRYIPVYTLEWQSVFARMFFSNFQTGFSDGGEVDPAPPVLGPQPFVLFGNSTIRFAPAPGSASEYRLVYRRRPPSFIALDETSILPESFDRVVEMLAEYHVRFQRVNPLPGWMEVKREAYQMLSNMRRKMSISMIDNYSAYWQYPYFENSSMYTSGLFIAPTMGGS